MQYHYMCNLGQLKLLFSNLPYLDIGAVAG